MSDPLDALAIRATVARFFLGWALAAYQRGHALDDARPPTAQDKGKEANRTRGA
jgi:hypothetical protein